MQQTQNWPIASTPQLSMCFFQSFEAIAAREDMGDVTVQISFFEIYQVRFWIVSAEAIWIKVI